MCAPIAAALDPQIPAAEVVVVVHAGEDRAGAVVRRQLDPRRIRERLVRVEVAGVRQFEHGALIQIRGLCARATRPPFDRRRQRRFSVLPAQFVADHRRRRRRAARSSSRSAVGISPATSSGFACRQPGVELRPRIAAAVVDQLLRRRNLLRQARPTAAASFFRGTITIGGVSLMLPSIGFCVVLLKNAASS